MSSRQLFLSLVVGWPAIIITAFVSRASLMASAPTGIEYAGWLFVAIAPVLTGLILARGQATRSMTQVLYDTEHAGDTNARDPKTLRRS